MANRLVSVDDNLDLPPDVQERLSNNVRTEFQGYVASAETASTEAVSAATSASDSAEAAEAAAASITVPTNQLIVDALINNGIITGQDGRVFKIAAGTIRNAAGTGWSLVSDAAHQAVNIASVTNDTDKITINYSFTALKVTSLVAVPDEYFASQGLFVGGSVGLSSSNLWLYQPTPVVADYVSYNGSTWTSANGVFTDFAWNSGTLTLTHASVPGTGAQATGRAGTGNAFDARLGGIGPTTTTVEWYTASNAKVTTLSTDLRAYVTRTGNKGIVQVNPQTVAAPMGNIWIMAILEVDPSTVE